jgi:hypothetical protein
MKGASDLKLERVSDTEWKLLAWVPKSTISLSPPPRPKGKRRGKK